jgi:hypothetical protein
MEPQDERGHLVDRDQQRHDDERLDHPFEVVQHLSVEVLPLLGLPQLDVLV